jgi:hypothetical protein
LRAPGQILGGLAIENLTIKIGYCIEGITSHENGIDNPVTLGQLCSLLNSVLVLERIGHARCIAITVTTELPCKWLTGLEAQVAGVKSIG